MGVSVTLRIIRTRWKKEKRTNTTETSGAMIKFQLDSGYHRAEFDRWLLRDKRRAALRSKTITVPDATGRLG